MVKAKAMTEMEKATEFLTSMRGQLIMAQALHTAIKTLEKEPYPEFSNIEDMKYVKEQLFNFPIEFMDADVIAKNRETTERLQSEFISKESKRLGISESWYKKRYFNDILEGSKEG